MTIPASRLLLTTLICSTIWLSAIACEAASPLADAAEQRDDARMRTLLKMNVDVTASQADGMTALHWTVYHDNAVMTRLLLDAAASATAANRYGVAPLSLACMNGNAEVVALLLAAGADADTSLPGGETALMTASRTGKREPVALLIDGGANVNRREQHGQTAIMWAAAEGHAAVVQMLIDAGAELNTTLKSGFTPFFFAVREGRRDVVQALLAAGADIHAVMRPARTNAKSVRPGTGGLMLAVENGHFELAVDLLKAGADPNDQQSGFTPLHALTWVRKPNRGDGADGEPAPIGSGRMTSLQFVRALVAHGADVNARLRRGQSGRGKLNHKGATPLLLAAKTNDVALIKLLLQLGADATLTNADACTPLLAAAGIGTRAPGEEAGTEAEALETVKLLLELNADVNAVDRNGETAMHGAAYKSLPRMVELLDARGAKMEIWNRKNKYGWTPHLIAEGHRPGNFKPAAATLAAIQRVMRAHGVTPPALTPRVERKGYQRD